MRDLHQFDADINGCISFRRVSQSNSINSHKFQIQRSIQSSISRVQAPCSSSDFDRSSYVIIAENDDFRLAQIHSFDPEVTLFNISCLDPPIPATTFRCSKLPHLSNLIISVKQIRARLITDPVLLANGDVQLSPQHYLDIQKLLKDI